MPDILLLSEIGLLGILTIWIIIEHFGGWPEAYYRARGINYFFQIIFGPDGRPNKYVLKSDIVVTKSLAQFENPKRPDEQRFYGPGEAHARSATGKDVIYYLYDDMNPITIFDFNKGARIPPTLVKAAMKNTVFERMHSLGRKGVPIELFFLILAVALIGLMISGVTLYYTHDLQCAIKPHLC
jgi:hypothetical protein